MLLRLYLAKITLVSQCNTVRQYTDSNQAGGGGVEHEDRDAPQVCLLPSRLTRWLLAAGGPRQSAAAVTGLKLWL